MTDRHASGIAGLLTRLLVGGGEIALAVLMVLVLAAAFMGLLVLSFPEGTGLIHSYDDFVAERRGRAQLRLHGDTLERDVPAAAVATLARIERRVRDRAADAIAWKSSQQGMDIGDRHTIQTLARSSAAVAFEGGDELRLSENSLVVISGPVRSRRLGRRRASLVLLGGNVRGRLGSTGGRAVAPLEIVTAGASSRILPAGAGTAEFAVTAGPDSTSTFAVYSGTAEVTSAGETVTVAPNQVVTVAPDEPPSPPRRIPDPPVPLAPPDGSERTYGSVASRMHFAWSAASGADAYRFALARDPAFADLVHVEDLASTEFLHGNLEQGTYYWRVGALSGGAESRPGETRSFRIVQDDAPPALDVSLPDRVDTDRLVVRGRTEPGVVVYFGAERVPTHTDGTFEHTVELERGLNMIVVAAVDAAGNSAYHSQYVRAAFGAGE